MKVYNNISFEDMMAICGEIAWNGHLNCIETDNTKITPFFYNGRKTGCVVMDKNTKLFDVTVFD